MPPNCKYMLKGEKTHIQDVTLRNAHQIVHLVIWSIGDAFAIVLLYFVCATCTLTFVTSFALARGYLANSTPAPPLNPLCVLLWGGLWVACSTMGIYSHVFLVLPHTAFATQKYLVHDVNERILPYINFHCTQDCGGLY